MGLDVISHDSRPEDYPTGHKTAMLDTGSRQLSIAKGLYESLGDPNEANLVRPT
jgi:hypothetical protein